MKLRFALTFAAAIFCFSLVGAQSLTKSQVATRFDQALRKQDGNLLKSVLRKRDTEGISGATLTKFLQLIVKPAWNGPSPERRMDGTFVPWSSSQCRYGVKFLEVRKKAGSYRREGGLAFVGPTIKEGTGYKSSVTLQQIFIVFSANLEDFDAREIERVEKAAFKRMNSWIIQLKKWGIKGSVNPETGKWQTWEEVMKDMIALKKKYEELRKRSDRPGPARPPSIRPRGMSQS